jgi:hypothetical protein
MGRPFNQIIGNPPIKSLESASSLKGRVHDGDSGFEKCSNQMSWPHQLVGLSLSWNLFKVDTFVGTQWTNGGKDLHGRNYVKQWNGETRPLVALQIRVRETFELNQLKSAPFTTSTGSFRICLVANLLPLIWTGQYPMYFFSSAG